MCKHVRLTLKYDFHQSRVLGRESEMRRHQVIGCEQKHHIIIFRADYVQTISTFFVCLCVSVGRSKNPSAITF